MALSSLLNLKNRPSSNDQSILTSVSGPQIDRDDVATIKELLKPIVAKATTTPDNDIGSLSVPRTMLREKILKDRSFRRAFGTLPILVQDLNARALTLSEKMDPTVYVKDTKYNKLSHPKGESLIPFDIRMRWLEDRAGEWGYVRIPAILILAVVGFVGYGAIKLTMYSSRIIQDYSDATAAAAANDAGLERAVKARAGRQPSTQKTEASPNLPEMQSGVSQE